MCIRFTSARLIPVLFLCFFAFGNGWGQGFVRSYPVFAWYEGGGQSVFPQPNGGFRLTAVEVPALGVEIDYGLYWIDTDAFGNMTDTQYLPIITPNGGVSKYNYFLLEHGDYLHARSVGNTLEIQRFDTAHVLQWTAVREYATDATLNMVAVQANASEEVFVRIYTAHEDSVTTYTGHILKFSASGALLWENTYAMGPWVALPPTIRPTDDGGCLFNSSINPLGSTYASGNFLRFNGDGALLWQHDPFWGDISHNGTGQVFDLNDAGQMYLMALGTSIQVSAYPLRLDMVSPTGALLQSTNLNILLDLPNSAPLLVVATRDGGAVVVVRSGSTYIAKINADGSLAWKRLFPQLTNSMIFGATRFSHGQELPDGSILLYAETGQPFLIKVGPEGVIFPHTLTGRIVRDSTFNCWADPTEPPLAGWMVTATGNGPPRVGNSNADGHYTITDLDAGTYTIALASPSYLWTICEDSIPIAFVGSVPITETLDFPIQAQYDCPLLEVDIAAPFLRRCMDNTYAVRYCNAGNQPSPTTVVTVLLDPLLTLGSASLPFVQDGQLLTFDLGDVQPGDCGLFHLVVTTSCDTELGQTLCSEARIYPDTLCVSDLPGWSGARVEVSAQCTGDSVLFRIQNTGHAGMLQPLDFIIVDDHVITRQGGFLLPAGGIQEETTPATGSTWRLIAQQEPNFPFGQQPPSVGLEGCTANAGAPFSLGMLNMFHNYSGNPFHDTDCRTVVGSWDPNDKQALPVGTYDQHLMEQNLPIEYLIRFQNTGTDTAFAVVIRDTLSPWLDPASIRPGAASHPYTWSLGGMGILTVVFPGIALPDSNANEAASHGFVQFHIDQRPDNPLGAVIENRVGIYFDFNEPVITNTVFHTVGKHFLPVSAPERAPGPKRLQVAPNPAVHRTTATFGELYRPGCQLVLRDWSGRPVGVWPVLAPRQEILRYGLPSGLYWLELRAGSMLLAVGKVVWGD